MLPNDPASDPVLIVSDGEKGDKIEKIGSEDATQAAQAAATEPKPQQNNTSADPNDAAISSGLSVPPQTDGELIAANQHTEGRKDGHPNPSATGSDVISADHNFE